MPIRYSNFTIYNTCLFYNKLWPLLSETEDLQDQDSMLIQFRIDR